MAETDGPPAAAPREPTGTPATLGWQAPVTALPGIGPARARALARGGIATVGDLLEHLPTRWEDRRTLGRLDALPAAGAVTVEGEIVELRRVFTRRRSLTMVRGRLRDAGCELPVVWFNRPYLLRQVIAGQRYRLHGELRAVGGGRELLNPTLEPAAADALHAGAIVPVYPALGELAPPLVRRLVRGALDALDPETIPEQLPALLRERHALPTRAAALAALHAPDGRLTVEQLAERADPAHARLVYGELLALQLELALVRRAQQAAGKPHRYRVDDAVRAAARRALPFRLTAAQRRSLKEIVDDLRRDEPMLRLLQGDVGSGKTIVAALAAVVAIENGLQVAFMAPTELLAEQQHATLARLLGDRYRVALLTAGRGADAGAAGLATDPGRGGAALVVGTHALIGEGVRFARLGLVVIDEQHRFGVEQRQRLQAKGDRPDVLVMTATPIPRSLALVLHGDLELSVLDELPPGRAPVATELVATGGRDAAYAALAAELEAGGRAYLVVPRIEEGEEPGMRSLTTVAGELRGRFPQARPAVVHGRQSAAERQAAMRAFAAGEVNLLLATTVVEVGMDVPEATLMLIEGAERFGLAQLHQLRGRVGRGGRPGRCLAVVGEASAEAEERLARFAGTGDGFALAEADLALRGPGEMLGTRQSGAPLLGMARLPQDQAWLERARSDARELVDHPQLAPLRAEVAPRVAERLARITAG